MDAALTQLGVGGILTLMVLKEVFGFVKGKNNSNGARPIETVCKQPSPGCQAAFTDIQRVCDDTAIDAKDSRRAAVALQEQHDAKDEDGLPRWFVPRSLKELAQKNHDTSTLMVSALNDIKNILQQNQELLKEANKGRADG